MAPPTSGSLEIAFAIDRLCDKADDSFRLAATLTGDFDAAKKCLKKAFEAAAIDIKRMALPDRIEYFIAHHIWRAFSALKHEQNQEIFSFAQKDSVLHHFKTFSIKQRAIIGVMDLFSLDHTSAASCLGIDLQKLKEDLIEVRKCLLEEKNQLSKDDSFFYANSYEFLEGSLDQKSSQAFEQLLRANNVLEKKLEKLRQLKGLLQLEWQKIQLSNVDIQECRQLLEPKEISETIESQQIDAAAQASYWHLILRSFAILMILGGFSFLFYKYFAPAKKEKFNSLEALTYESLALEEDGVLERFNFPSQSVDEIQSYFKESSQLNFSISIPSSLTKRGFKPEGASVIDYDIAQVAAIAFINHNKDKIFYFTFEGSLNKLPASTPIAQDRQTYMPYASSEVNLIAWQAGENVIGFVVSRLSIPEMIKALAE